MPNTLVTIEEALADFAAGKMVIVVDDENRENEGDLVIAAEKADAAAINFMAKYGRGLICLTLPKQRVEELGLPLMAAHNLSRHQTAFTVSIEAREGVTTGISAADRARTIAVAIDPAKGRTDIASPGHVFPLMAKEGGVLVRAGHTEASVDMARLSGLNPSAVICEIMNDDGTMARLPDLQIFARHHGLKIASIADLIAYRRRRETLVKCIYTAPFTSVYGGEFTLKLYVNTVTYAEHIVLTKGKIDKNTPCLVRMHAFSVLDDALGDVALGKQTDLQKSLQAISAAGQGVVVLLREPLPHSVSQALEARSGTEKSASLLRDYGVGAQILLDVGVRKMILLSNSKRQLVGLEGYQLEIEGYQGL